MKKGELLKRIKAQGCIFVKHEVIAKPPKFEVFWTTKWA